MNPRTPQGRAQSPPSPRPVGPSPAPRKPSGVAWGVGRTLELLCCSCASFGGEGHGFAGSHLGAADARVDTALWAGAQEKPNDHPRCATVPLGRGEQRLRLASGPLSLFCPWASSRGQPASPARVHCCACQTTRESHSGTCRPPMRVGGVCWLGSWPRPARRQAPGRVAGRPCRPADHGGLRRGSSARWRPGFRRADLRLSPVPPVASVHFERGGLAHGIALPHKDC